MASDETKLTRPFIIGTVAAAAVPTIVIIIGAWLNLRGQVGEVRGEVTGLTKSFAAFDSAVERLDNRVTRLDELLREFEVQFAAFSPDVSRFQSALNRFQSMLSELSSEHRRIETRLGDLQRNLTPAGTEPIPVGFFQDVTARLRRIEERLNTLAGRVGASRGQF